jgi:acyl carrier protein
MSELQDHPGSERRPLERVIALVERILGHAAGARPLPLDARLSELGMSSLKMINLMLAIEVEFDLAIPQSAITPDNFESIASVEALLITLLDSTRRV